MKIIILILVSFNLCAQNIERSTINLYDHEIKIPLLKKENQRDKNFLANFYAITALPDNIKAERNSIDIMLKEDSVFSKFFNELNYQKYKCTSFSKENSYVESSGYKFNRLIVNCDDGNEIMMESYIYNKASDFKDRIVEIQKDNINNTLLEMSYYKNGIVKSKGVTMRKYLEFPVGNWYFYNEDGSVKKMINADNQYRLKIENVLRILKKHKIVLPFNNDQMQTGEATYIKIKTAINRYLKTNYGALWKIEFSEWKNSNKDDLIYHIIIIEDKTGKILANEKLENADEIVKYWEEGETKKIKIIFLNSTNEEIFPKIENEKKALFFIRQDFQLTN
ncbi:hypothetical protein [Soonwooa sp.]|uniref:hypothetical protein n=1 Tax=Soonwooa sp. TaxID=1938592 RepID=UPI0026134396|nr:hypothetical protein [Soonwooa sp.]